MERRDGLVLVGKHVRLEPLALDHVPALVAAISEDPASFRFSTAPDDEAAMSAWVQDALAGRETGRELPFATYSCAHERIVGSTRVTVAHARPSSVSEPSSRGSAVPSELAPTARSETPRSIRSSRRSGPRSRR